MALNKVMQAPCIALAPRITLAPRISVVSAAGAARGARGRASSAGAAPNAVRVQESAAGGVATPGHAPAADDAAPSVRPSVKRFELRPPSSSGYSSDPYLRKSARQVSAQDRVPDAKDCKGLPRFMDKVRVRVCLLMDTAAAAARLPDGGRACAPAHPVRLTPEKASSAASTLLNCVQCALL